MHAWVTFRIEKKKKKKSPKFKLLLILITGCVFINFYNQLLRSVLILVGIIYNNNINICKFLACMLWVLIYIPWANEDVTIDFYLYVCTYVPPLQPKLCFHPPKLCTGLHYIQHRSIS